MNDDLLRYPIGRFARRDEVPASERGALIDRIAATPRLLAGAVAGLTDAQLDTPYRPGGWTLRQVVHHLPDSHVNAYVRCRLALTAERPTIVPYAEAAWAELPDARSAPVGVSIALLSALHERWVLLLSSLDEGGFRRTFVHPENGVMTLDTVLGLYAWHGDHHIAQIRSLRERQGW